MLCELRACSDRVLIIIISNDLNWLCFLAHELRFVAQKPSSSANVLCLMVHRKSGSESLFQARALRIIKIFITAGPFINVERLRPAGIFRTPRTPSPREIFSYARILS